MKRGVLCFLKDKRKVLLLKVDYGDRVVWNGLSGYIDDGEDSTQAAMREIKEEIGVTVEKDNLECKDSVNISEGLSLDIYIVNKWNGTPSAQETSIKKLKWVDTDNLPYDEMHEGNKDWLPKYLK